MAPLLAPMPLPRPTWRSPLGGSDGGRVAPRPLPMPPAIAAMRAGGSAEQMQTPSSPMPSQAGPDLQKIKRNVAKMASMRATVAEIDDYIASQGVTLEEVQATRLITKLGGGPVKPMTAEEQAKRQPSTNLVSPDGKQIFTSGGVENASAGLNNAIYQTVGGFADRAQNVINWGIAGANAVTGQKDLTTNMLRNDPIGGSKWLSNAFEQVGVYDPDKVIATNLSEELARLGGEGAGYAIAPELLLGAFTKAGIVGKKAQDLLGAILGESKSLGSVARNATAGAAGGIGAGAAMEVAPDNLDPLAATLGGLAGAGVGAGIAEVPSLARTGARLTGDHLAPLTQGGRERMAGEQLREAATSPGAAIEALQTAPDQIIPGSMPTTFQKSGDMGLGALERGAATADPATFMQRRAEQNTARLGAMEGVQPTGAPEAVVTTLRNRLAEIDQMTQAAVDSATTGARRAAGDLGPGATPDVAGEGVRGAIEASRTAAKAQERALWQAVDPDGSLALPATSTRQQAARIASEMPTSAKAPDPEEAAIFQVATSYGDVVPFSEITALQSRLKTAMREERFANGESPAYRRLTQLNSAVQNDLESAVAQKVSQEQQAVAAGQMRREDTVEAALEAAWTRKRDSWLAGRNQEAVGGSVGQGTRSFAGSGSPPLPRDLGAASQGSSGFDSAPRNPGVSPRPFPNFDDGALGRLNSARAATKSRAETFDNPTLAPIRKRPGATYPYDMPAGAVPGRLFFAGPKSFDAIQTYGRAVGPRGTEALVDYAIDRLRRSAMRDDGTMDPAKLATWRKSHSDALRALPELDARLNTVRQATDAMMEAAAARKAAIDEAEKDAFRKLLDVDDPSDVARIVGNMLNREDAAMRMLNLRQGMGDDEAAAAGLRRSILDHLTNRFVSNTEAGTSGQGAMKGDQFVTFVKQKRNALKAAGFTEKQMDTLDKLAADLQRAGRSQSSVRIPGQSNTAQDVLASKAGDNTKTMFFKIAAAAIASGGLGATAGGFGLGAVAFLGSATVSALRQMGIRRIDNLVKDAVLDPRLALALMMKARPKAQKEIEITFIKELRRAMLASLAVDREAR